MMHQLKSAALVATTGLLLCLNACAVETVQDTSVTVQDTNSSALHAEVAGELDMEGISPRESTAPREVPEGPLRTAGEAKSRGFSRPGTEREGNPDPMPLVPGPRDPDDRRNTGGSKNAATE
jgi:hypothetical protein